MKLVEYLRTSTDDKGQDPTRQQAPNRERAAKDGHEIVGTVVDEKPNGKSSGGIPCMEREGFLECIAKAKELRAGGIIVENVDRLTRCGWRDLGATLFLLDTEHDLKVVFADVGGTDEDDPNGGLAEVIVPFSAYLARLARQRIRATTKSGMANARRRKHDAEACPDCKGGHWCAITRQGRPPSPELEPDEWTLYEELKQRGWGMRRIAVALTDHRLKQGGRDGSPVVDPKARAARNISETLLRRWVANRVLTPGLSVRFDRTRQPDPRRNGPISLQEEAEAT